jgi:hypothetical protein
MALKLPCAAGNAPKNTGIDCAAKLGASALYLMVPISATWTDADEADFLTFIQGKIHADAGQRWYPLFGKNAPIRTITDAKENDVLQTFDDGSTALVRLGMYARTFLTDAGGLAFAQALQSFNNNGRWAFIEVDKQNQVLRKKNNDGTYSGIPLNLAYAVTPSLATLKDVFQNAFYLNFDPTYYIGQSVISQSDENLVSNVSGLINAEVVTAAPPTATSLTLTVRTIGTQSNLAPLYPPIGTVAAWSLINTTTGAPIVPTAATINGSGNVVLTIASTSGTKISAGLASAASLLALNVEGYECVSPALITIP